MRNKLLGYGLFFLMIGTPVLALAGFAALDLVTIKEDTLAQKIKDKFEKKISFELVDLRLESDYGKGHIPGAVNIPLKKLRFLAEQRFGKADDIVFYGYSQDDHAAVNAVILLVNKGFEHVSLVEGGIEEWKGKIE